MRNILRRLHKDEWAQDADALDKESARLSPPSLRMPSLPRGGEGPQARRREDQPEPAAPRGPVISRAPTLRAKMRAQARGADGSPKKWGH